MDHGVSRTIFAVLFHRLRIIPKVLVDKDEVICLVFQTLINEDSLGVWSSASYPQCMSLDNITYPIVISNQLRKLCCVVAT